MEHTASLNTSKKTPLNYERVIYSGALALLGISVLYLFSAMLTGLSWLPIIPIDAELSSITLPLIQCILGAVALHLPLLITKLTRIKLPAAVSSLFYVFVVCGTVLGEMFSLYYLVPFWDDLLHFASGMMAGMLGSILLVNLAKKKQCQKIISPALVALAALCFALSIGAIWEVYEFVADSLLGLNMQKFLMQSGAELAGKAALLDTMKDLIIDSLGAIVAAVSSFTCIKRKRGWLYGYMASEHTKKPMAVAFEREVLPHTA